MRVISHRVNTKQCIDPRALHGPQIAASPSVQSRAIVCQAAAVTSWFPPSVRER